MEVGKISGRELGNTITSAVGKAVDDSFEIRLKNAMDKNDAKELKKTCQEFESIFLNMLYKQMKASVPRTEFIPGDPGKDIFDSMLDDSLMEEASRGRGMGLADMLYKQLSQKMESAYKPGSAGEEEISEEK